MNYHSHEVMPQVRQLKQAGKLEEALKLLETSMEFHENKREEPSAWPYSEAAIVLRKLKRYPEELAVLERVILRNYTARLVDKSIAKRLPRAYVLADKGEKRKTDQESLIYHVEDDVPVAERPVFLRRGLVVDVETTGLGPEDEIVELAMVCFSFSVVSGHILAVEDSYTGLRDPSVPISAGAARTHGIEKSQLVGKTLDVKAVDGLIARSDLVVAHNASFDRRFIANQFPEIGQKPWYCSMNGVPWRQKGYESKGLQPLLSDLDIDPGEAHRGLSDASAVVELLSRLDPETNEPFSVQLLSGDPIGDTRSRQRQTHPNESSADEERILNDLLAEVKKREALIDRMEDFNDRLDTLSASFGEEAEPPAKHRTSGLWLWLLLAVLFLLLALMSL